MFDKLDQLNCLVELHLHLDGAISAASVRKLAALQNIAVPEDEEELLKLVQISENCHDLNEILARFGFPNRFLQTPEGIEMAVRNLLEELRALGVMYAEIRYSPTFAKGSGVSADESMQAMLRAINGGAIPARLILCMLRGGAEVKEDNMETLRMAEKYFGQGVCAIDLAGAEGLFPTENFAEEFAWAREHGIPFTIHAGEAAGPESIHAALGFGARRLGHGVRCVEEPGLPKKLAELGIPLELCETSNECIGLYADVHDYPLRRLMEAGCVVTVNSDDPAIERTNIRKEYEKLIRAFDLNAAEVKQLLLNGVEASFADAALKETMRARVEENFAGIK